MTVSPARQAYLDWVRGVAVLIMIEAHVLDSWTSVSERARPMFGYAMVLGGFGAPLFLFLAGIAVVLSAESKHRRTGAFGPSWRAAENRGWQIFGLAFLFRIQSYVLSGFQSAVSLLKVDILNIMGPAMVLTAIGGRAAGRQGCPRCVVRRRGARDGLADAHHSHDSVAELASRSDRVVFPADPWPYELYVVPLGRVRVCRSGGWRAD